jgi:hypothetical protein
MVLTVATDASITIQSNSSWFGIEMVA